MDNISQVVESSLARHGVVTNFDHLRLQWSNWFRCQSSFSVLLAPAKAGIFALAEEIVPPSESAGARASSPAGLVDGHNRPAGKRMLALFEVFEADDLGMALGRLFLPGASLRDRLTSGKCFARYAVLEDPTQRRIATEVLRRWMQESAQQHPCGADTPVRAAAKMPKLFAIRSSRPAEAESRDPIKVVGIDQPSTSFAWGMEVQGQEVEELKRPQPLPSGF